MERNTKVYLMPLIAVSIFTVLLFTAGYAYFTSSINMNTANYQISMPKTTSLVCTKTDCNVTITPAMMTNTNTSNTTPKSTSTCSVSCTCSGSPGAVCNYGVGLFDGLGDYYEPSSGIGSDKELSFKINTSDCDYPSSSEMQLVRGNNYNMSFSVASCSLTVPASGSKSAVVSVEFRWYNLNIDQSSHAGKTYIFELRTH